MTVRQTAKETVHGKESNTSNRLVTTIIQQVQCTCILLSLSRMTKHRTLPQTSERVSCRMQSFLPSIATFHHDQIKGPWLNHKEIDPTIYHVVKFTLQQLYTLNHIKSLRNIVISSLKCFLLICFKQKIVNYHQQLSGHFCGNGVEITWYC